MHSCGTGMEVLKCHVTPPLDRAPRHRSTHTTVGTISQEAEGTHSAKVDVLDRAVDDKTTTAVFPSGGLAVDFLKCNIVCRQPSETVRPRGPRRHVTEVCVCVTAMAFGIARTSKSRNLSERPTKVISACSKLDPPAHVPEACVFPRHNRHFAPT